MKVVPFKKFTDVEKDTWRRLFQGQEPKRRHQIYWKFNKGIELLGLSAEEFPDLEAINSRLHKLTGFKGVPVEGLEEAGSFFEALSRREFPIGNFIRSPEDLSYTPAPDIFHDLYGHLPFLTDSVYADATQDIGERACRYLNQPSKLVQFERLYWFAFEFGLIETPEGRRVFGGGIASSISECDYALSDEPEVLPFDMNIIRRQEYKIDDFQRRLFLLKNESQLFDHLDDYEKLINSDPSPRIIHLGAPIS